MKVEGEHLFNGTQQQVWLFGSGLIGLIGLARRKS